MTTIVTRSDFDVELIDSMGNDLSIARSAWVSTGNDAKAAEATDEQIDGLLKFLMNARHGTPFESVVMQLRVCVPIFLWREWHRHRIASYNEESGRYKKLEGVFYIPGESRRLRCIKPEGFKPSKPGFGGFLERSADDYNEDNAKLTTFFQSSYDLYEERLAVGYDNGLARICLPVDLYSACYVTMNARAWMNFLSLRVDDERSKFRSHPLWELHTCVEKQVEPIFARLWPITYKHFINNGRVAP